MGHGMQMDIYLIHLSGADQSATDQLVLNRGQLYNRDLSIWGGQYTGTSISIQRL